MPRNSQGGFTLPAGTLVASGDTILVSQHNPAMADIEQALGNSLDRKGSGGMLADLPMNGNRITGAAPGIAPTDVVTMAQISSGGAPTGTVVDFAGATAPVGWLLCGGQSLSRTDYAALFAVIGTAFGAPDATTFSLPDLRGRVSAGADFTSNGLANRLSLASVGASGGAQSVALTIDQMPSHGHTLSGSTSSAGTHTHGFTAAGFGGGGGGGGGGGANFSYEDTTDPAGEHSHTLAGSAANTGGGQAHTNVQPTLILNKIIRTGKN